MVRETCVQSLVASYQRLLKWYLILLCLSLSIKSYVSRVKWSNPGKGVASSPTSRCISCWKKSLLVSLDYGRQLYLLIWLCVCVSACVSLRVCFIFLHLTLFDRPIYIEDFNVDWFSILSRSHSLYHLKMLETLYVLSLQPSLCKQRDCLLGLNVNGL